MATQPEHRNPEISAVEIANLKGEMHTGFAAMGGKLDTLIAKQEAAEAARALDRTTADARHEDHEARLRTLESHDTQDHGERITAVEQRKTIAPWQLWTVFAGAAALVISAAGVVVNAIQ